MFTTRMQPGLAKWETRKDEHASTIFGRNFANFDALFKESVGTSPFDFPFLLRLLMDALIIAKAFAAPAIRLAMHMLGLGPLLSAVPWTSTLRKKT